MLLIRQKSNLNVYTWSWLCMFNCIATCFGITYWANSELLTSYVWNTFIVLNI